MGGPQAAALYSCTHGALCVIGPHPTMRANTGSLLVLLRPAAAPRHAWRAGSRPRSRQRPVSCYKGSYQQAPSSAPKDQQQQLEMSTAVEEVLGANQALLDCVAAGDWQRYTVSGWESEWVGARTHQQAGAACEPGTQAPHVARVLGGWSIGVIICGVPYAHHATQLGTVESMVMVSASVRPSTPLPAPLAAASPPPPPRSGLASGNLVTPQELCDGSLTCFEPEAVGHLVEGLPFHKFYFDLPKVGPPGSGG